MSALSNSNRISLPARFPVHSLSEARFLAATVLAPLAPVAILWMRSVWQETGFGESPVPMMVLMALASYAGLYLIGLPGLRSLYRTQQLSMLTASLLGFCIGLAVMGAAWAALAFALGIEVSDLSGLLWSGMLGLSVTLAFVLIAGIPERNQDQPKEAALKQ